MGGGLDQVKPACHAFQAQGRRLIPGFFEDQERPGHSAGFDGPETREDCPLLRLPVNS